MYVKIVPKLQGEGRFGVPGLRPDMVPTVPLGLEKRW